MDSLWILPEWKSEASNRESKVFPPYALVTPSPVSQRWRLSSRFLSGGRKTAVQDNILRVILERRSLRCRCRPSMGGRNPGGLGQAGATQPDSQDPCPSSSTARMGLGVRTHTESPEDRTLVSDGAGLGERQLRYSLCLEMGAASPL